MRVFLHHPFDGQVNQLFLARLSPDIQLIQGPALPEMADYQVLVAGRPPKEYLSASPQLHSLVIPFAGLPEVTRASLADYPHLAVYNLHHNAAPTAELALALLLAAAKFLLPFDRQLRLHDWRLRYQPSPALALAGKTALILGYGHIGQRLGSALQALEMRLLAVRRRPGLPVLPGAPAQVYPPGALPDLLPQAQVLIVTLPLTPQTRGLVGQAELERLPPGAVLVNVGRGPVVDQAALYAALREGRLAAAGLDVWYNYPNDPDERANTPPADFPFHELENVVLSPHRAGLIQETENLRAEALADLLNALARNQPPAPLDLDQGY
jgi:phosphoglycerate dehydrogenase-like enzyme